MKEIRNYLNANLRNKIESVWNSGITVVVAPAGYGKTTFIKEALSGKSNLLWFTSVKESSQVRYARLCKQLKTVLPEYAKELDEIGYPNRISIDEASDTIRNMTTEEDTYLILDNYQMVLNELPEKISQAFIENTCEKLHIIVISQTFGKFKQYIMTNPNINKILKEDLILKKEDILKWYSENDLFLNDKQLDLVYRNTTGWVLGLSVYLKTDSWDKETKESVSMEETLDHILWNQILDEQKILFMILSIFDIWELEKIEDIAGKLHISIEEQEFSRLPLIRYNEQEHAYYPHVVLMDYLKDKLKNTTRKEQKICYIAAGEWFDQNGCLREAIECYDSVEAYDRILAEDIVNMNLEPINETDFTVVAENIVDFSSREAKTKYIISYLRLAYMLFGQCKFDYYNRIMREAKEIIEDKNDESLKGEWLIISAFEVFPDVRAMTERYRKAALKIKGKCQVVNLNEPFLFGCTSMWALFHSKAGKMLEVADDLDQMMAIYSKLTGGHGCGAECIYRGESYCVQGKFEDAQLLAYKAAYFAEANHQVTIAYASSLLLGIIAVYRSDMRGLEEAIEYLEKKASTFSYMENKKLNQIMLETVRGYLLGILLETQKTADWVQATNQSKMNLTFMNFMIYQSRVTDMILNKKYKQAIACTEVLLTFDKRLCSVATKNFMYVGLALCYLVLGNIKRSAYYLEQSLEMVKDDQNYTFLARFRKVFQVLFLLPGISKKYANTIREIKELKTDYAAPDEDKIFLYIHNETNFTEKLSKRELEIAHLAADGLHNREIAEQLHISEWTVKTHLQSIYNKLDVDRRSKLFELLR